MDLKPYLKGLAPACFLGSLGAHSLGSFTSATISFATLRKALSSSLEALSYTTYLPFPILSDINPSGISESEVKT
jgi:hypothetical protein